jgi:phosphatidylserine decarboxylase
MNVTPALRRFFAHEDVNFLVTNRIPRIALTKLVGRLARIDSPAFAALAIGTWKLFTDLDLAESPPQRYRSLRECFTRPLKPGARSVDADPAVLASPCDGIVGACGPVQGRQVFQAKGFPYTLADLFGPTQDVAPFVDGSYVTLRLTSAMYHRFHAPHDLRLEHVTHIAGDTWNVNPIALKRVERLFCRNERAVLRATLADGTPLAIVPVAAILVASLRLHALDLTLHVGHRGPHELPCDAACRKGDELGWFEQGSTILVFAPRGVALAPGIAEGVRVRMGQALMTLPRHAGVMRAGDDAAP